jgi:PAS domain S-box-containing protein
MGGKPTYQELLQRVRQLEIEASEGKATEQKLKEKERRWSVQYKHIPIPTYTWQKSVDDLVLTDFNDAAEKITQGKIGDYVGIKAGDMYGEFPEVLKELRRCFSEKTVCEREMPYRFISTGEEKVLNVKYAFVPPDSVVVHTEDVTSRVEAERKLKESYDLLERRVEERTAELAEANVLLEKTFASLGDAVFIINPTTRTIIGCNAAVERIFGYKAEEVVGRSTEFLHIDPDMYREFGRGVNQALDRDGVYKGEFKMKRKDGKVLYTEHTVREIADHSGHRTSSVSVLRDITEEKHREQELRRKKEELEERTRNLERLNTALKVLLDKRDQDIKALEDKVLSNMKQLVVPFLEKLGNSDLNERQKIYLEIVQSNLNDIISPFVRKLSAIHFGLTPTEIRVANLVKEGRTTKDIAALLNSSMRAVRFHRENLRKKLGLKERKVNLRTYLLSAS